MLGITPIFSVKVPTLDYKYNSWFYSNWAKNNSAWLSLTNLNRIQKTIIIKSLYCQCLLMRLAESTMRLIIVIKSILKWNDIYQEEQKYKKAKKI